MKKIELVVESEFDNERLDKYIMEHTDGMSRSRVQKLIEMGNVLINENSDIKKNTKLSSGDHVMIMQVEEEAVPKPHPEDIALDIVYEDDDVIVVNKARGMVVHSGANNFEGTLVNALMHHTDKLSVLAGEDRAGIVHRIDKDTTGLLVVAKSDLAYESLAQQLRDRTVNKRYDVIVHGGFNKDSGVIDYPIERDKKNRLKMNISPMGRPAVTRYEVVERLGNHTLISAKIETGRTHQIRVHMKAINRPVVGDPVYGVKNDKYSKIGQMLHAKKLGFHHPRTGEYMEFEVAPPADFEKVLLELKRKNKK